MADAQDALARGRSVLLQEVVDQKRNVLAALAQRRHGNRNHAQAVVKILAEGVLGDLLVEIAVGGGDDAHVDGDLAGTAHRAHAALLQHAQQLDLHGQGHLADFVEKDGALDRRLRTGRACSGWPR